ncbi:cardioacceleratory peptide receptor-like [Mytilus californianus]|uniref:cardioacceleratory peptide receptor-like n=1 Tax=Mytilus californianus TaxID=6549 RepID=UPI0022454119|nr:cardioacceleratory peptide receptor-like [Mytilus californianus]XP_052079502.1 cardioacceleratory peptide receptor-like [Mytilus californianus]
MAFVRNLTIQINGSKTLNETASNDTLQPQFLKWISLIILLGIIFFNLLLVVLLISRNPKSRMRFFVTNLAIADFCVGILFVLPETLFNWFNVPWNPYVCYIYYVYFSMVPFYVSTYAIVVLSIDRAYVIVRPLAAASKGKKYRYGLALSAWVIGCILAIPYGVFGKYDEEDAYCLHESPTLVLLYSDLSTIIIIPIIVITVCYIVIIITIRGRERNGFLQGKNNESDNGCDTYVRNRSISKAKIRTIKLLCIVVCAYIICWAPITIAAILTHHGIAEYGLWFMVLYILAPVNSLGNPLVFLIFNQKMFRSKKKKTNKKVFSGTTFKSETETLALCS